MSVTVLRYAVAALAIPLVGTATSIAFNLGGPGWAGAVCIFTLLACALCAVPWHRR